MGILNRSKLISIISSYSALALITIIIAGFLISSAFADTNFLFEAESGSTSGSVRVISDATASGGSAIQFFTSSATITIPNPGTWTNVTNNLVSAPTECGTNTLVSAQLGTNRLLAGVAGHGLYASDNFGNSWFKLAGETIRNRPNQISYDPAHIGTYYEAGIYDNGTGGMFKTTDNGATFQRLGSVSHLDSVSVDYTDPNRQTILGGGHEQSQSVWKSTNGGSTWTNVGTTIPAGTGFTTGVVVINSQTYVVNTAGSGIYRTTNGGSSWTKVSNIATHGYPPLVTTQGVIYYSDFDALARSSDGGLTWTRVGSNFREAPPSELPDGRLIMIGGDHLYISNADGTQWSQFGATYPASFNVGWPPVGGTIYSPGNDAFYMWHWDCSNAILPDSIMMLK